MKRDRTMGHLAAALTVAIWGTTFISTKILLVDFQPVELLFFRFAIGLAALVWACYSVLTKKISGYGYPTILATRRIFCYGIMFMLPALFLFDFRLELTRFTNPVYLLNIIFLGLGASALCFVTWNFALKMLGAVKTSSYIYMVPVITVVASAAILREKLTPLSAAGTVLTLTGLLLSTRKPFLSKGERKNGPAK